MSDEFNPLAEKLTSAQHLSRAQFLSYVIENRIAALTGKEVHANHLTEMTVHLDLARLHIELAREIDRQRPEATGGELVLAKLTLDDAKKTSEAVEDLPEITIDHPTRGWIRWSWENICWERMKQSGPQGGTP